ncbi:ABC transporter ATP-binding protein [Evansella sp. AB-rgal1]|uniref:ABC transporter ATP-binding protein n=1 Tax=Evansella sp. AB-rgal1 TaxID=3242696 RepID=UPI00359F0FCB
MILQVENLHVSYRKNFHSSEILNNISFELKKGEILALLGESGSGKSTLAKALTGLLPPSAHIGSGTLHIGSTLVKDLGSTSIQWDKIRGRMLSMIFQDAQQAFNPLLTMKENFKEILLYHGIASSAEVIPVSTRLLRMLNFQDVNSILHSYPFQLSGGMCQRICLALSLCLKPTVLIADEPTSALDTINQIEVLNLMKKMQKEFDLTVLLITHDIAVANAISDRVIVLNKGVIVEEGDTNTVLTNPKAPYTRKLLLSRSLIAKGSRDSEHLQSNVPILEIIQLEKTFSHKKRVLQEVNLTLHKQEIIGIIGQSGCGKSTLAKCITGLEAPSRGRILYRGTDISRLQGKEKREVCKHIQLVFQDARASLNPRRTALELVQEPLRYLKIGKKNEKKVIAEYYLNEVGLHTELHNRRPPQLSTGQCQRIAIARALVLKPEILICDEAVSALDMRVQSQILLLLQRLHKQFEFSILIISHDIRVVRSFCHKIAVMKDGSFCEIRNAGSLLDKTKQSYTQILLKSANEIEGNLTLLEEVEDDDYKYS